MATSKFIRIPQSDIEYFERLLRMSEAQFQDFVTALSSIRPAASGSGLGGAVALSSPLVENAQEITRVLVMISQVKYRRRITTREAVNDLALDAAERGLLDGSSEHFEEFSRRLTSLLEIRSVELTAKAAMLNTQHENIFADVRIMTELRPIFSDEGGRFIIEGSIMTHQVEVEFHADAGHKSQFFTLDSEDIRRLHEAVERALKKEAALQDYVKDRGFELFG